MIARSYAAALLLELLGGALGVIAALRTWQTVVTPRPRPLGADVLAVAGREVDAAALAFALVALAGVVAVLATRGIARQVVGAVLTLAGVGLVWRSVGALSPLGAGRARDLVRTRHPTVGVDARIAPAVTVHPAWPVLSLIAGLVVLAGGLVIVRFGGRWRAMSSRYERTPAGDAATPDGSADAAAGARLAASYWNALDRGEDPTSTGDREAGR